MKNNMETVFIPRAYAKHELALLYFPESKSKAAAVDHFMKMVKQTRGLYQELLDQGYRRHAKWFTPKEVAIITGRLGEP